MKVTVLFFASCRETTGQKEITLNLDNGETIAGIRDKILRRFPDLRKMGKTLAFARNSEYVGEQALLNDGDEVAVIPPVSGG